MRPLAPADIRARKRPVAILSVYVTELLWALVVATPVHAWARRAWGAHPDGDGLLFRASGRELLVWLGQDDAGLAVTARTTLFLIVLGAVVMQLPLGALLASLAFSRGSEAPAPADRASNVPRAEDGDGEGEGEGEGATDLPRSLRPLEALRAGLGSFMALAGALALGTLAAVIVLALGAMASSAIDHAVVESLGDARAFQLRLVTFGVFLAIAAVIGVIIDLARAAIVRESGMSEAKGRPGPPAWTLMLRGVKVALQASRRALARATVAWAWRGLLGLLSIAVGYYAARALGGRGGLALTALFVIHQAVVLVRVALRASWLARAIAIVAPVQDTRDASPPRSPTAAVTPAEPIARPAAETP